MFEDEWIPNAAQQAAIDHGEAPLLVLAGAGTGKTATVAGRVARLLRRGVAPERICLLTFSRRAAQEMLRRAGQLADPSTAGRVWGGTFHAVGQRLLRRHGGRVGLEPGFTVLDESDAVELIGFLRHELGYDRGKGRRFPKAATLAKVYSRVVNAQEQLPAVLAQRFPWCAEEVDGVRDVIQGYLARKRAQHLLDFDDLLLYWRALGELDERPLAGLFDYVLVDEYQDTNALQGDIVELLAPEGRGLCVVGDDAQAIYSFRAATPHNILRFPERYPGASVIRLEENYRSTGQILAVANAVMAEAAEGYGKTLWSSRPDGRRGLLRHTLDEPAQAAAVCESVLTHRESGLRLQDQAVLFRAAHHSDALEVELHRRNIPFVKYGGLRFLEAAHVKDLLALLRILDNPFDELSWFRVLQLVEGIGPGRAAHLSDQIGVRRLADDPPSAGPLRRFLDGPLDLSSGSREELALLQTALRDCLGAAGAATDVSCLRRFLDPSVKKRFDQPQPRLADLDALERVAAGYATRTDLLADLTLDPPSSTSDLAGPGSPDDDWLVLSTVHSAKGGEWRAVHLIHASDGLFPSDLATGNAESIEEERRLFYVAVTRAKDVLEINATQRYYYQRNSYADRHGYGQLSRFLSASVRAELASEQVHATPIVRASVDDLVAGLLG
jgi:DNA helicase-2/ATP-dependent DNA helicase PcrA